MPVTKTKELSPSISPCSVAAQIISMQDTAETIQADMFPRMLRMAGASGEADKQDNAAWVLKLERKEGVRVYNRMMEGSEWAALKATVTIPKPPALVRDVLMDRSDTLKYDDMMGTLDVLEEHATDHSELRWCKYKAVWPTQARDFVALSGCMSLAEARKRGWLGDGSCTDDEEGSYVIASKAAEELMPLLTPNDATAEARDALSASEAKCGCVRGTLKVSGYLIKSVPDGTEVTIIAHSELNGNLPAALINRFAAAEPAKVAKRIKDLCISRPIRG